MLFVAACAAPQATELYSVLAESASDPAKRLAVCTILDDDLQPEGRATMERYRGDSDPLVRGMCYRWLIRVPSERQGDWLLEALGDPSSHVQANAVLSAGCVEPWSQEVSDSLWELLQTCSGGHLFEITADALIARGGSLAAYEVFDTAQSRGNGWLPFVVRGLARHPDEVFRGVFEAAANSDDWDDSCLGRRALQALDSGEPVSDGCLTTNEFHELWRAPSMSTQVPEVLAWDEFLMRLRGTRVIVFGELHAAIDARATQIAVLAELCHAKRAPVVLVVERPVLEYQEPVIAAARQHAVEVRTLESEELAMTASPAERDVIARHALAQMVAAEPDTTFVVCYGDNHRRSLQTAVTDAGVHCMAIALTSAEGMLASAMRATQGRVHGRIFHYPGHTYFLPPGSYATSLGSPELDEVFLPANSR